MKEKIHPEYRLVTVVCACGETFQTRSTREDLRLEICSKCHPFFTGKQKLIDSAGRVERFQKRYQGVSEKASKGGGTRAAATEAAARPAARKGAKAGADAAAAAKESGTVH